MEENNIIRIEDELQFAFENFSQYNDYDKKRLLTSSAS